MSCVYSVVLNDRFMCCTAINGLVGVEWAHPFSLCDSCVKAESRIDFCEMMAKRHLRTLLIAKGGRTNIMVSQTLRQLASRYLPRSTVGDREEVVREAIAFVCVLPDHGGRPAGEVLQALRDLEQELDVVGTLAAENVRNLDDVETRQWNHDEGLVPSVCGGCNR